MEQEFQVSQRTALQQMDADIVAVMADNGIAEAATYTPPGGGAAVPCTVMVDRDTQPYAVDQMSVATARALVTIYFADVPVQLGGGVVHLTEADEDLTLGEELHRDESRVQWIVE